MNVTAPLPDDHCDVVVVGAGLSGVLVAEQLAATGLDCLLLEAGPVLERRFRCRDDARAFRQHVKPLLDVDGDAWAYQTPSVAFDWIRVRAGGGRSLLWGGWCLRPDEQSFRDARAFERAWPFSLPDLESHLSRVERWLGVQEGDLDPAFEGVGRTLGLPVVPKRAAAGPCGCRAVVSLDRLARARVRPNTVVTRVVAEGARVTGVEIVDAESRRSGFLRARAVVLSASPIETSRLLLSADLEPHTDALSLVGRGFVDHLVSSYLVLLPRPAAGSGASSVLERSAFVPRFVNLGRRARRDYRGGFTIELHGPEPLAELPAEGLRALNVAAADASELSYYLVHAMGETAPHPDRFVDLHPSARDGFDRPLPRIHVRWNDEEHHLARDMEEACVAIADSLAVPGSRIFPLRDTLTPGGTAHEGGTCPIGRSPKRSVVDMSGRVHGVGGLYVADASLLPSGLDRPPTLTVLALALNTADGVREAASRAEL